MVFVNFKMRMKIESLFIEWCEKNRIAKEPNSMVVFMIENGWLNEEKINKDLHNKALEYYESKRKGEPHIVGKHADMVIIDESQKDCPWK